MKRISKIEIVHENMDTATIPAEELISFSIKEIKTVVKRIAVNAIVEIKEAVGLEFSVEASKEYANRVEQYHDITGVCLFFEDGTSEYISVPYKTDDGSDTSPNLFMHTLKRNGKLLVYVQQ